MIFNKQDLVSDHYQWKSGTELSLYSGEPTRRSFDRFCGDQVLLIINYYCYVSDVFTVQLGRKIESEILNRLPIEAKSELSVFNWIRGVLNES
jgi:hypothetical protein